jgi:hypothetical protein
MTEPEPRLPMADIDALPVISGHLSQDFNKELRQSSGKL